jgi:hypothetical protein
MFARALALVVAQSATPGEIIILNNANGLIASDCAALKTLRIDVRVVNLLDASNAAVVRNHTLKAPMRNFHHSGWGCWQEHPS